MKHANLKHENLRWNPATRVWFCVACGRSSDNPSVFEAQSTLEKYDCGPRSEDFSSAAPWTETVRLIRKPYKTTPRIEKSGCRFVVVESVHSAEIKLELFHEMPSLKALPISFEVLRGITVEDARALADRMNEKILGIIVAPK